MKIKEVIVVEGRDDETAVKQAVEAEIIITHGFGIKESTFQLIKKAQGSVGVIVLTDPDYAGEQIRKRISDRVPGVKHAFIPRALATKDDDIGIENAKPDAIIDALNKAHVVLKDYPEIFTKKDLLYHDLIISEFAVQRRDEMGKLLGIGYGNAKTFLKRLNSYGITREEFEAAASKLGE
ncbi:MAG: ribonuclease M5 [Clostridia bacterium]|nr:ribonuclease M5 [Clostridia bacterium]